MRARPILSVLALLVLTAGVSALPATQIALKGTPHHATITLATDTADYIRNAAIGNMFEVNAARVAVDRAQNDDVRRFAHMSLADYSASSNALEGTLKDAAFEVTLPDTLDDPHAVLVKQLQATPNEQFDAAYMQAQILAQESAMRLNASYARTGRDKVLRAYAAHIVPQIRMRLTLAERIFQRLSAKTAVR